MNYGFNWQDALQSCREILRHDPDHLGALETLAKAQWMGGQYKELIETTHRLLRLNPHEPGYRFTRGMAYLSLGQLHRSAEDLRRAYLQSNNPSFKLEVASALDAVELWLLDAAPERRMVDLPDLVSAERLSSVMIH